MSSHPDIHSCADVLERLEAWIDDDAAFGMSDLVLSGFVRVVTHPRVFRRPTPTRVALEFASAAEHFHAQPLPSMHRTLNPRTHAFQP